MRIAVTTDSGSGISRAEAKELNVMVAPLPIVIDGREYLEGVNISREDFFKYLREGAKISTSMPSLGFLSEMWDKALADCDAVIHIPLSSGLSGSCQAAKMLADDDDYEGKVFVCDNHKLSVTQRHSVFDALKLIELGFSPEEIVEKLEAATENNAIYIAFDTLACLKRGGRIQPGVATIGALLNIKPVLVIPNGDKLGVHKLARNKAKAHDAILQALKDDLTNRFNDPLCKSSKLYIAYSDTPDVAEEFKRKMDAFFPDRADREIDIQPLPYALATHIGPGGVGGGVYYKGAIPEVM